MKEGRILLIAATVIIGILIGVIYSKSRNKSAPVEQETAAAPVVEHQHNYQDLIEMVEKEPGNRHAWVELGNHYLKNDQPMEAINAFDKALELDAKDPEILTDQGIIFRRLGWLDKAAENFSKANKLDPAHSRSLLALGVVYIDKKENEKARDALTRFLEIVPTGKYADQARMMLEHIKKGH